MSNAIEWRRQIVSGLRERLSADRATDGEPVDLVLQRAAAAEAQELDLQWQRSEGYDWQQLLPLLTDEEPAMRLYAAQKLMRYRPEVAIPVLQDFATGVYGHGSMSIDAKETLRVQAKRLRMT